MLFAFIGLGMFFGSDGIIKIPFDRFDFAGNICSVALIFIMFYGGFGTNWSEAKPVAFKAILLSSFGVIFTAFLTGLFCYYFLNFEFFESFLIGSVISSTDAATVFSILRYKNLNLKYNTSSLLELESGSNDPCSYMLTVISLSLMKGSTEANTIGCMIFKQIFFGLLFGFLIAYIAYYVLKKFNFKTTGFGTVFIFAVAVLAYALPSVVGGNGYLSTYIVGIILGNKHIKNKKALVNFFDGLTGLMQMLIFFLLGLLSFPSKIPNVITTSILISLFLTFVARPISVFALLTPAKCNFKQQLLIAWAGLRGAASFVFAIMASASAPNLEHDIFHIVFCIVLFSLLLQGSTLPLVAKWLKMTGSSSNVLKIFNDYSEEVPVHFIQLKIKENHPWKNKSVENISLPPDTLFVLLMRSNEKIIPNGKTVLQLNDIVTLSAPAIKNEVNIGLTELNVNQNSDWDGKTISSVWHDDEKLILLIKRDEQTIIPNGNTILNAKDILIISTLD